MRTLTNDYHNCELSNLGYTSKWTDQPPATRRRHGPGSGAG